MRLLGVAVAAALACACGARAQEPADSGITRFMRDGIPSARPVPVYTLAERAAAAQRALGLRSPPVLGAHESLTPDAPFGPGGAHLSIWKPSFVLGTAAGGEVGINFWGLHTQGHVNVAFTPAAATTWLLDCRLLSAGAITWKIYDGPEEKARSQGRSALVDNHVFLLVPALHSGDVISVELWPTPDTEPLGFLGCDLGEVTGR